MVLWHAWRNTIYCAIEAYKELFRHKRNEEKRQELISCFQKVWTASDIFGRLRGEEIKWNLTPHQEFLPKELVAWNTTPIRIHRLSPSPDAEEEFTARADFSTLVDDFLQDVARNWRPPQQPEQEAHSNPEKRMPSPDYTPSTPQTPAEPNETTQRMGEPPDEGEQGPSNNTEQRLHNEDRDPGTNTRTGESPLQQATIATSPGTCPKSRLFTYYANQ